MPEAWGARLALARRESERPAMPLNRTAKVDIVRLQQLAREEVAMLRERGRWDA